MRFSTQNFLNLFLQNSCPLCQRTTTKAFCVYCEKQLEQQRLANPAQGWQEQPAVFAWGNYGGHLKRAIAQFKYENQPELAQPFGEWIAQAWLNTSLAENQPVIVPIPLHPEKLQKRGFNQAELLAKRFCQLTGCSLKANGLQRSRETEALFSLSKAQREQTLAEAFEVGKDFSRGAKSPVILFDDIYTSGATVRSAMQTLRRKGIRVQGAIVLAKTSRTLSE